MISPLCKQSCGSQLGLACHWPLYATGSSRWTGIPDDGTHLLRMITTIIPGNHPNMKSLLTQIGKLSRSTIVVPRRYYACSFALCRRVSVGRSACVFRTTGNMYEESEAVDRRLRFQCCVAKAAGIPEQRCYRQAVARSASVAGAASTPTPGTLSKESTSSEGLIYGGLRFSAAAPSDRR